MAEDNSKSLLGGIGINLPTIIQIATFAAIIYAQWTVLGRQVTDLDKTADVLAARVDALSVRLYAVESAQSVFIYRLDSMQSSLTELRRQSGLRSESSK